MQRNTLKEDKSGKSEQKEADCRSCIKKLEAESEDGQKHKADDIRKKQITIFFIVLGLWVLAQINSKIR